MFIPQNLLFKVSSGSWLNEQWGCYTLFFSLSKCQHSWVWISKNSGLFHLKVRFAGSLITLLDQLMHMMKISMETHSVFNTDFERVSELESTTVRYSEGRGINTYLYSNDFILIRQHVVSDRTHACCIRQTHLFYLNCL